MRLGEVLTRNDLRKAVEEFLYLPARAPADKGADPIPVSGYMVRAHWRRRGVRKKAHAPQKLRALP